MSLGIWWWQCDRCGNLYDAHRQASDIDDHLAYHDVFDRGVDITLDDDEIEAFGTFDPTDYGDTNPGTNPDAATNPGSNPNTNPGSNPDAATNPGSSPNTNPGSNPNGATNPGSSQGQ